MAGAAGLAVLADLAGWLGFSAFSGGSGASGGSGGSAGSGIAATSGLSLSASPLCSLPRGLKLMPLSSIRILVLPSFFLLGLLYFSATSSSEPGEQFFLQHRAGDQRDRGKHQEFPPRQLGDPQRGRIEAAM